MKYSWYNGKIFGVKIFIHWAFLLLFAWIIVVNIGSIGAVTEIAWTFLVGTIFLSRSMN